VGITFGLDISHHQDLGLDLARCKREGISFVFIKATEGDGYVDSEFAANLAEARSAGLLVAAYHYVRSGATAAAQAAHIGRVVPKSVPVIPDVEAASGGVALTRDIVNRLQQAGYRVPLLYLPRWYWQQLGSPSLAGLPPLWSSRYPDTVVGSISDEWADVPATYWNGYGGLSVAVLQFTSAAAIAGYQPLDANAFRGTATQLAALLGGVPQEDDVNLADRASWTSPADRAYSEPKTVQETIGDAYFWASEANKNAKAATEGVAALKSQVAALQTPTVDLDALADKIAARLGATLGKATVDALRDELND
jgi:hypothetical protein